MAKTYGERPLYGEKTDYRKINIYVRHAVTKQWSYACSTTWAPTCHEAKTRYIMAHPYISSENVRANFA